MADKYVGENGLQALLLSVKNVLKTKSDTGHTHDRVNGYKIVVSTTAPTVNDTTIITIVK